ncbi:Iron/zinc purple acid phosphatase-like protein [Dinothrombium tinctorium]|uniref:Purple acid phosphatase n=1 Tax=Dinothrombium tinctorium TaxID=1965070 RepID=A0A3S3QBC4_9ACAR|nr:Iron/zinc purple acid phosphatase-like protein [Dinothrombium tinctorium]RWS17181.1 Iron/zinc purple acid phosphatase-like protein [Dinothrombium tinctorium]
MVITWSTLCPSRIAYVRYGTGFLSEVVKGHSTEFIDGGEQKRKIYIHRVFLTELIEETKYYYKCFNEENESKQYSFTTLKNGSDWSPRIAVIGDLGLHNAKSAPLLMKLVSENKFDILFHNGDFGYDLDWENGKVGDAFLRFIEPIAARVPYMTSPGNHEEKYNFSNYDNRFTMIDEKTRCKNNHFHSFNIGPAHIISFSTEFYFFTNYGSQQIATQYEWLKNDLMEANLPENREKRPWVITFGHRPMYCSGDRDECHEKRNIVREGIRRGSKQKRVYGLEELFYENKVDIAFWAHQHSSERSWPVYNNTVYNGSTDTPYINPKAPVHIISGNAGNNENLSEFDDFQPKWSAKRILDFGFVQMTVLSKKEILIQQVSATTENVIDEFRIMKNIEQNSGAVF